MKANWLGKARSKVLAHCLGLPGSLVQVHHAIFSGRQDVQTARQLWMAAQLDSVWIVGRGHLTVVGGKHQRGAPATRRDRRLRKNCSKA